MSDEGVGLRPNGDDESASVSLRGLQSPDAAPARDNRANVASAAATSPAPPLPASVPLAPRTSPRTAAPFDMRTRPVVTYTDMRGVAGALALDDDPSPSDSPPIAARSQSHRPAARLNCSCTVLQCAAHTRRATCTDGHCEVTGAESAAASNADAAAAAGNPPKHTQLIALQSCSCRDASDDLQAITPSRSQEILGAAPPPQPSAPLAVTAPSTAQRSPCAIAACT